MINAVTVPEERRADFEARFAGRAGHVAKAPGFEAFELMRPAAGGRYFVYTRWRSQEDFDAWKSSNDFSEGHRQHGEGQPVASGNEVLVFEVLESEYGR